MAIVNGFISGTRIKEASQSDSAMGSFRTPVYERSAALVDPSSFVPFSSTKSSGTSLTFAIARTVARQRIGSVQVTVKTTEQFRFELALPRDAV